MIHTGIDWADESHCFCILDDSGVKLDSFQIPHGYDGFISAQGRIAKYAASPQEV